MLGLYIHIPFCKKICNYCDFTKRVPLNEEMINEYLLNLEKEFFNYQNLSFDTIYIGGGTPSILTAKQLDFLLGIFKNINPIEYSIECNPDSLNEEKIIILKKHHVNRVSIGVETFNDRLLNLLGRSHKKTDVINCIKLLKKHNINNINIDLMFSLPTSSINDVKKDLAEFYKLDIPHISYYSLILEEKTVFYLKYMKKELELLDEEIEAMMYKYIIDDLKKHKFNQYEISNFSKDGYNSIHNMKYWENKEYIGIGMGASGYYNGIRYKNASLYKNYIKNKFDEKIVITKSDKIKEEMMLGLRMNKGINIRNINNKYNIDIIAYFPILNDLKEKGLINIDESIYLTKKGLLLGNEVFVNFV